MSIIEPDKSEFTEVHGMYRKATLNDCDRIYHLICDMECKQLPFHSFYSIFQGQLDDRHYYCLVCECGDVIGVLNLRFENAFFNLLLFMPNLLSCYVLVVSLLLNTLYRKEQE